MSRTNDHKKVFKNLIAQYCPSCYFGACPPDAGFPRVEYEFKQLAVNDVPYEKYILTLNCYNKTQTETIDNFVDALILGIDKCVFMADSVFYQFYYGQDRQIILEPDKTIKRIMLTFEVRIYPRSEE
ncbi:MAG: hypothetical protein II190_01240 [Ruminococcus sp.]|nr:hypothetical protein [Ruminococcus sp.]